MNKMDWTLLGISGVCNGISSCRIRFQTKGCQRISLGDMLNRGYFNHAQKPKADLPPLLFLACGPH